MQIKVFTLSLFASSEQEEEVNKFLRCHRILTMDRCFSSEGGGYWTLLITYQENGSPNAPSPVYRTNKKDYREILTDEQFAIFAKMKDIRRNIAKQESIPAYAVFTDEELSLIVQMPKIDLASIKSIKGVGKRAEKYGAYFIFSDTEHTDETSGKPL